jgi:curved DNA-binding protein CbpA
MASNSDENLATLSEEECQRIEAMYARLGGTYYEILGVARDASSASIRVAYRECIKLFHPDAFWGCELGQHRPYLEAILRELTIAFEVLCNPRQRELYDESLARAQSNTPKVTPPSSDSHRPPPVSGIISTRATPSEHPREVGPAPRPTSSPRVVTPLRPPPRSPRPVTRTAQRDEPALEKPSREITLESLARGRAESILTQRRKLVEDLEARAAVAANKGLQDEVVSLLRQASNLAPGDERLRAKLLDEEQKVLETLATRYVTAARRAEKDGRWETAVEHWLKVSQWRPNDVAAMIGLAAASCEARVELHRAADHARKATQAQPDNAEAHVVLARVFFLSGRTASARGTLEVALRLDPKLASAQELAKKLGQR